MADADRALLLGQQRHGGRELRDPGLRRGHHAQQLDGRHDPVARRGVLADDHVAALLAAQAGPRHQHRREDVLVADGGPDDPAARGLDRVPGARRWTAPRPRGCPRPARRARAARARGCRAPGRRRRGCPRRRPPRTGRHRRRGRTRRAAPAARTASAREAGAVAPQSRLMLSPSGASWITVTRAPVARRISGATSNAAPFAVSSTTCSPAASTAPASPLAVGHVAGEQRCGVHGPADPVRRHAGQLVRPQDGGLQVVLDVVVELEAAGVEDLEPVVLGRVVRRRDHDPGRELAGPRRGTRGPAWARCRPGARRRPCSSRRR